MVSVPALSSVLVQSWDGLQWDAEDRVSSSDWWFGILSISFFITDVRIMALQGLRRVTANQRCFLKSCSGAIAVRSREKNLLTNLLRDKNEAVKNQLARIKSSSWVCVMASNTYVKWMHHGCSTWVAGAEWPTRLYCQGALERRLFGQSNSWMLGTGTSLWLIIPVIEFHLLLRDCLLWACLGQRNN